MTKKRVTILIILVIVLIAAIVFAILLANMKKDQDPEGSQLVSDVNFNTVVAISVTDGEDTLSLQLRDGEWYVRGTDEKIDQVKALSMSTHLCYVYANEVIVRETEDLSVYGLAPAKLTAQIITVDGIVHTFYYGNPTIDNASVFMMKEGDDHIYTIITDHYRQLASNITMLKNLDAPEISNELQTVTFKGESGSILFSKQKEGEYITDSPWQISQPIVAPLSPYVIQTISKTVSGLRLEEYLGTENKNAYGISNDSNWFECTDVNGNHLKITFGNDQNEYYTYCKVDGKEGFYTISKSEFEFLNFAASDFLDSHMITYAQPIKGITITHKNDVLELKSDNNMHVLNGIDIEEGDFNVLIKLLSSIRISGTVDQKIKDEPDYILNLNLSSGPFAAEIKLYNYRKSFYAVDFGDGAYVYVHASEWDEFVNALS